MRNEVLNFVRALEPSSHSIFFYSCPTEKRKVLFTFLRDGLEKGRGAIYITGQETPMQIRKHMEDFGINVKTLEKKGSLKLINYDQCYIIDGKVDTSKIFAAGKKAFDAAAQRGLNGLNVCGETSCFFEHRKERDLMQYELKCGRKLNVDVTAICAYDISHIKSLDPNLFLGILKAHGFAVTPGFADKVRFETFYSSVVKKELEDIFGTATARSVLWHLENRHLIKKEEIGENPEAFITSLELLFGPGAEVLEKAILESLFSKIGL